MGLASTVCRRSIWTRGGWYRLQHVVKSLNVIHLKRSWANCDPKPYSNWQLTKCLGQFSTHESAMFLTRTTLAIDNGTVNVLGFIHLCREKGAECTAHVGHSATKLYHSNVFHQTPVVTTFVHSSAYLIKHTVLQNVTAIVLPPDPLAVFKGTYF